MAEPAPTVQVACGTAERQSVVTLPWQAGLTAAAAVERSGLLAQFPEIDAGALVLGIYGSRVTPSQPLEPGDRVEIGRPLIADPRDMRRAALSAGGVMGRPRGEPEP